LTRNVALIYVRVSRLDEDERARKVSPEMQREKSLALREMAGLEAIAFEDLDISGKDTAHRPQYLAMMQRLEAGDVRYVVAYDQSRVTRDLGDLQHFRRSLAEHGAQFIEASTGRVTDPHDEDQELSSNVLGSVDQHYRRKVQRRVRDALASKVAHGELVGPVPAGYVRRRELTPDGTKVARLVVELDPEKAPIIALAFHDYATGAYSLKSLARSMNDRGVSMPRSPRLHNNRPAAEVWTADVLKDILNNSRYVGLIPRRDGTVHKAAYPALVDQATWTACERVRLRQRTSIVQTKGTTKADRATCSRASSGAASAGQPCRARLGRPTRATPRRGIGTPVTCDGSPASAARRM
jgi:site-specific DNA recombinase